MACLRTNEPQDQADHSRLALARRTDQSNDFTGLRNEIGIRDDLLIFQIRKIYVAHTHGVAEIPVGVHLAALGNVDLLRQFHQLAYAVGRDRTLQERGDDSNHAVECR